MLKNHMQHYQAAGLQSDKIQPRRESKIATVTKNGEPIKSIFSPEPLGIFGLNFVWHIVGTLFFRVMKMNKKICSRIRS